MKAVRTQLHVERKRLGWTQEELSRRSGITRSTLAKLETGCNKGTSADVQQGLALAFGIEIGSVARLLETAQPGSAPRAPSSRAGFTGHAYGADLSDLLTQAAFVVCEYYKGAGTRPLSLALHIDVEVDGRMLIEIVGVDAPRRLPKVRS